MSEARVLGSPAGRAYEPTVTRVKTVRVIPPTIQPLSDIPAFSARPRRVAAYARVSTSSEEQLTSYEAQVKHYTEYIKSKEASDNWQFVDVYTDKGITGVSTKKREGFNRMIQDALAGKIDLIITKSVSRFARNTVDTLTAIRKLKEYGVEVYFEEQNIYTLDGKGEVLLTIRFSGKVSFFVQNLQRTKQIIGRIIPKRQRISPAADQPVFCGVVIIQTV